MCVRRHVVTDINSMYTEIYTSSTHLIMPGTEIPVVTGTINSCRLQQQ